MTKNGCYADNRIHINKAGISAGYRCHLSGSSPYLFQEG